MAVGISLAIGAYLAVCWFWVPENAELAAAAHRLPELEEKVQDSLGALTWREHYENRGTAHDLIDVLGRLPLHVSRWGDDSSTSGEDLIEAARISRSWLDELDAALTKREESGALVGENSFERALLSTSFAFRAAAASKDPEAIKKWGRHWMSMLAIEREGNNSNTSFFQGESRQEACELIGQIAVEKRHSRDSVDAILDLLEFLPPEHSALDLLNYRTRGLIDSLEKQHKGDPNYVRTRIQWRLSGHTKRGPIARVVQPILSMRLRSDQVAHDALRAGILDAYLSLLPTDQSVTIGSESWAEQASAVLEDLDSARNGPAASSRFLAWSINKTNELVREGLVIGENLPPVEAAIKRASHDRAVGFASDTVPCLKAAAMIAVAYPNLADLPEVLPADFFADDPSINANGFSYKLMPGGFRIRPNNEEFRELFFPNESILDTFDKSYICNQRSKEARVAYTRLGAGSTAAQDPVSRSPLTRIE